jgi:hypothetical protein
MRPTPVSITAATVNTAVAATMGRWSGAASNQANDAVTYAAAHGGAFERTVLTPSA